MANALVNGYAAQHHVHGRTLHGPREEVASGGAWIVALANCFKKSMVDAKGNSAIQAVVGLVNKIRVNQLFIVY